MLGIESTKECVVDIEIMNTTKSRIDTYWSKVGLKETIKVEIKLIWMPGIKPVMQPTNIPNNMTNMH